MRIFNYPLLTAQSMGASVNSPAQQLNQMQISSIQASWTGSPVGTLSLQITNNDPDIVGAANVIWTDYTGSSTIVNGAGNFLWNLASVAFIYVRVVYTRTSGTGSLTVTVTGKGPS